MAHEQKSSLSNRDCCDGDEAAISGKGVVLGYSGYVEAEFASGALIKPFDPIVPITRGYHLVYLENPSAERLLAYNFALKADWQYSTQTGTA